MYQQVLFADGMCLATTRVLHEGTNGYFTCGFSVIESKQVSQTEVGKYAFFVRLRLQHRNCH